MNDFPEWEKPEEDEMTEPEETGADAQDSEDFSFADEGADMPAAENAEEDAPSDGFLDATRDFPEYYAQVPPAQEMPRPVRKGRPKRRKGEGFYGIPNIIATIVWIGLVILIGVTLGRMLWITAAEVLAFGREDKSVTVTVYESDDIDAITQKLYKAGLIRYPGLFKLYADFAVDEGEIHPGIWDLNTLYDYHALVKSMAPSSTRAVVKVMIPEGYSCRQIFNLLESSKVCTVQDMEKYMVEGELPEFWFLNPDMPRHKYCLEGYLFPDTYEFYQNEKPENVVAKMLGNFQNRFDDDLRMEVYNMRDRIASAMKNSGKSESYIKEHSLGIHEIVTIASMIEKETATPTESFTISSVIYNRLFYWGNTPAYLNIDAAIVYALDGKTSLSAEDLQIDSPYNTYKHTGLTPGPISNPGLNSLKAALYPANTNYYYYVLDPATGEHHFSRTLEEHNAFRARLG